MILIEDYMQQTKEERQHHIDLSTDCIDRKQMNGAMTSVYCRGLLAHLFDTSIPDKKVLVCHACNNNRCSNPKHLYWGTSRENVNDSIAAGTYKSPWVKMVEKYGLEEATKKQSDRHKGNAHGKGNKGKKQTDDHKRNVVESRRRNRLERMLE